MKWSLVMDICVCTTTKPTMKFQYLRSHERTSTPANRVQSGAAHEIDQEATTSRVQRNTSSTDLLPGTFTFPHRMQRIQQHQYESYSRISLVKIETFCTLNSPEIKSHAFIQSF